MQLFRTFVLTITTLALVACGGGDSDSGAGGSSGSRQYAGSATLTLSSPGVPSVTASGALFITINGRNVTVSDGADSGTAPMSADGRKFSVPVTSLTTDSGVTCRVTFVFNGNIAGNNITGTVSGNGRCTGSGVNASVFPSGNFSVNLSSTSKSRKGSSFSDGIAKLIHNIR